MIIVRPGDAAGAAIDFSQQALADIGEVSVDGEIDNCFPDPLSQSPSLPWCNQTCTVASWP